MANRRQAHADNAPGAFFVDSSCIDCGTCYTLAPAVFEDAGDHSRVHRQPADEDHHRQALLALVACPTGSIGATPTGGASDAAAAFPVTLEDEVSFCGYTSAKSFGAWSYFVERPSGNVMMDSPRAAAPLMRTLQQRGGVELMVLSHRDDVADHAAIRERFGCRRLMHRADRVAGLEAYVEGEEPVATDDQLVVIPVPGHTAGSICLLYRDTFLFTGDHLWWNPQRGMLSASRSLNWYSWPQQLRSLEKLLAFDFRWVLPGHGQPFSAESPAAMRHELERALVHLRSL